jgi:hypothetical protein
MWFFSSLLEVISWIPAQEDDSITDLERIQVVLGVIFVAYRHASEVLPPGAQPLGFSTTFVPPQ